MTGSELFGLIIFLGICYVVYRFAKKTKGSRNTDAGGETGAPKEVKEK